MGDFKFRVWDRFGKMNSRMTPSMVDITGLIVRPESGTVDIFYTGGIVMFRKDEIEILPSTGHRDAHGKEIFEGDIISYTVGGKDYVGSVLYSNVTCCFYVYGTYLCGSELWVSKRIEVMGNVYENPDFLKNRVKG